MPHRQRLTLIVVLINLFVIGLTALFATHGYRQSLAHAEVTTENLAFALESDLHNTLRRIDTSLLALLDIHEIHHVEHEKDAGLMTRHIEKIRARLPEVDAIRMTDANGRLVYGSDVGMNTGISLADRPHFLQLRDNPGTDLVISQPQVSRINNKWVIALARRIEKPEGGFGGIIFAAIALDSLSKKFAALDLGPGGAIILRDSELRVIAGYPDLASLGLDIGRKFASPELQVLLDAGHTTGTYLIHADAGSLTRISSFRKLTGYPLYVSVGLADTDYLAAWRAETARLAILVTLFLLASLYATHLQHRAARRQHEANLALQQQEALYHELVEDTPVWVVRTQPDTTITFANTTCAEFFATTPAAIAGRRWVDFIHDATDREALLARIAALTPEQPVAVGNQHRVLGRDGQTHWTQWTERAFFDARGRMTYLQAVGEDITERKRARDIQAARLRLMEFATDHSMHELLVATLDEACALTESPIGFYHFLDADQKTLSLQAWSTLTARDYCKAEGEGRHYNVDEAGVWVEAVRLRQPVIHNDYAALTNKRGLPPGHAALIREMVVPVFRKGLIVAILGVGNKAALYTDNDLQAVALLADLAWDFAEGKRLEAELVAMATTDYLTGLYNRRTFMAHMEGELARLKRFDIERAAVLMLDIDHFKRVNDNFGHAAGDAVLRQFAALISNELRQIDTGGRVGGEEFAILLIGADIPAAEQFAERVRARVEATPLVHEGQSITVTVSIGIATLDADDATPEAALTRADAALYAAKRGGRNRICVRYE